VVVSLIYPLYAVNRKIGMTCAITLNRQLSVQNKND